LTGERGPGVGRGEKEFVLTEDERGWSGRRNKSSRTRKEGRTEQDTLQTERGFVCGDSLWVELATKGFLSRSHRALLLSCVTQKNLVPLKGKNALEKA